MSTRPSLASDFQPAGHHPDWWPIDAMRSITPFPVDWVRIVELTPGPASDVRCCALIPIEDVQTEMARPRSVASEVGEVEVFDGNFHDGLVDPFGGRAEFFCQVRWQEPATEPAVEWALPFLWYWRAIRQGNQWIYLDSAGRDVELARIRISAPDDYAVEVRALALRHYLHLRGRALLLDVQVDQDHPSTAAVEREEHPLACDWASMEFQIYDYDGAGGGQPVAASSLHGQYVVLPADGAPGPAWCTDEEPATYPEFIYGLDTSTGRPLTVRPTIENAGTDGHPGPYFWTRIYFNAQVLDRYLAEPRRYTVTGSRISCLHVWSLSIGRTSDNLVEVDLYDLSRMPWREWDHWRAHNVAPAGGDPDEGKLRRERLNQVASSPDIVRDLRTALGRANDASQSRAGWPLWRPLAEPTATEWTALHPPVVGDRIALQGPLLTLSKVLVDSIDSIRLRQVLLTEPPRDAKSLTLLQQYVDELGGSNDAVQPLRELQDLRSQGGFAHYTGSSAEKTLTRVAGGATTPAEIFENICVKLIGALDSIATGVSAATAG